MTLSLSFQGLNTHTFFSTRRSTAFKKLQKQLDKIQHPSCQDRAMQVKYLADSIQKLRYDEYRILVGTLNMMRRKDYSGWLELLDDLDVWKDDLAKYPLLLGLVNTLEWIVSEELKQQEIQNAHLFKLIPTLSIHTPLQFCENLMKLTRVFYPLGINILNPSLHPQEGKLYLHSNQGIWISHQHESIVIYGCSTSSDPDLNAIRFKVSLLSPFNSHTDTCTLKAGESLILGRGSLQVYTAMGCPFRYKVRSTLSLQNLRWSRAALLLCCSQEGDLFLYDCAARNPYHFTRFDLNQMESQQFKYDPSLGASTPLFEREEQESFSRFVGDLSSSSQKRKISNEMKSLIQSLRDSEDL